jgi:hypothetical protein
MIAGFPRDWAFDIEREPYAVVQTSRPVDGSSNELPRQNGLGDRKQQTVAADIYGLTNNRSPVQRRWRYSPTPFNCKPQGETAATTMISNLLHWASGVIVSYIDKFLLNLEERVKHIWLTRPGV